MTRIFSFFILLLFIFTACTSFNSEKQVISGKFSWTEWRRQAGWESYNADNYEPGVFLTEQLNSLINNKNKRISFILFSASWCGDSESEVPKIFKMFDIANIPLSKIELYGVDRAKRELSGTAEKFNILRVPTLIVLKNGNEIGRIVEHPLSSWEEDIFKILIQS